MRRPCLDAGHSEAGRLVAKPRDLVVVRLALLLAFNLRVSQLLPYIDLEPAQCFGTVSWLVGWFVRSFVRSFVRLFVGSLVRWFVGVCHSGWDCTLISCKSRGDAMLMPPLPSTTFRIMLSLVAATKEVPFLLRQDGFVR